MAFFAASNHLFAQQVTFSKVFSNFPLNGENGISLLEVKDGYLLLTSHTCFHDPNSLYGCLNITKLSKQGDVVWTKDYPEARADNNRILEIDGRFFVSSVKFYQNDWQLQLYCLDFEGNILWQKEYGDSEKFEGSPEIIRWKNNIIFLADKRIQSGGVEGGLIKLILNFDGDLLNTETFTSEFLAEAPAVSIGTQNNLLISYGNCPIPTDCFWLETFGTLISMSDSGTLNWKVTLPQFFRDTDFIAGQIDSSKIAIIWQIRNDTIPNHVKTPPGIYFADTNGVIFNIVPLQNQTHKTVEDMAPIFDKGLIVSGSQINEFLTQGFDAPTSGWLLRMNVQGEVLWERDYYDTTYLGSVQGFHSIIPTSDGGFIASGTIDNDMTGVYESHNWVLKLDSLGCLLPGCGKVNFIVNTQEPSFFKWN